MTITPEVVQSCPLYGGRHLGTSEDRYEQFLRPGKGLPARRMEEDCERL
jgi:hypothetical protein